MSELAGKVALITGASQGIGLAVTRNLVDHGVSVAMAARNKNKLLIISDEISQAGGRVIPIECDVSHYEDVEHAIAQTIEAFGTLDILVNNAGTIDPIARMSESDPSLWSKAVDVNVKGVYFGMRAALRVMEAQHSGVIINMSSGAANSALEGWSHYCSTKAAVKKLTECAHQELKASGIRVVGLSPGTVATDMMVQIRSSGINAVSQLDWSSHIPPEWVGKAVAFLCTSEASEFDGSDFSIKTEEGRRRAGLVP